MKSDTMTREDLEVIFNWNTEFSTAFKDIKAENITKSPLTRVFETPAEIIKAMTEFLKPFTETMAKGARERRETEK